jgi:hypothetical protein
MNKQKFIQEVLKCDICKHYLVMCMYNPVKVPLDYREIDGKVIACTISGKPYDEYVKSLHDSQIKEAKDYYNQYESHIKEHLKQITEIANIEVNELRGV